MPSTLSKILASVVALLVFAVIALGYYLNLANGQIVQQGNEIRALSQRAASAEAAISKSDLATRELRTQLSVLRVALQQSTNIKIDASGAVITKKGAKSDGIELR